LYGTLDYAAWRAFEAVEEAWIRDRYELLVQQAPAAINAAKLDLEIKLADLSRRAIQFRHLMSCDPSLLRGGIWQLTALPVSESEDVEIANTLPEYRKVSDRIRMLTEALRRHREYGVLQRAQVRLWKTPQYREVHRRYTGRMQELQRLYGSGATAGAEAAVAGGGR
jgi:hypothetical protein